MRVKAPLLTWLICMFLFICTTQAQYSSGTGAFNNPYLIYTAGEMNAIGAEPNDWDKHFKLMADIDLKDFGESSFNLIGSNSQPFRGALDGNGHNISNLTFVITGNEDEIDPNYIVGFGLFRIVNDPNAVIKNLSLINPNLCPASTCQKRVWRVGGLVGSLQSGTISNCDVEGGQVQGERWVGGLVGLNFETISDCHTTCNVGPAEQRSLLPVIKALERNEYFGGLVGYHYYGVISNCYATGRVTGETEVGGLVGETRGEILNSWSSSEVSGDAGIGGLVGDCNRRSKLSQCYATGHISGRRYIGGLAGTSAINSSIDNCFATGSVLGGEYAGGLVGGHNGDISECYSTSLVVSDVNYVGGLVGFNKGTIYMSCAHGHVSGKECVGGLVGYNQKANDGFFSYDPVVAHCYATGVVRGENYVGGLMGCNGGDTILQCYSTSKVTRTKADGWTGGLIGVNGGAPIENSFWDTVASGQDRSEGGTGESTAEMKDMWMYLNAGWDFEGEKFNGMDDAWKMCCGRPIYPKLAWEQILVGDFVDPEGVDIQDLAFLAEHWLQTVDLPCNSPDLTMDARVDIQDFARMAQYWGRGAREIIFETTLDEPPDWIAEGQWQFGIPAGDGGSVEGHPDPIGGYTGDNVYGVNLQGDYTVDVDGPHYLTAGPYDCRLYRDVELEFARWLNTDEADYVHTTIEFSFDGMIWASVWEYENTEAFLTEDAWQTVVYNLGTVADHRKSLYLRWGYEIRDVEAWSMSGWNIDDIKLSGARW